MKKILLPLLTIFCSTAIAQTNQNIGTVGTTFSPDSITIDVGDTVTWTNNGGTHNVNGTTVTFGSNPESFTNGSASTADPNWRPWPAVGDSNCVLRKHRGRWR